MGIDNWKTLGIFQAYDYNLSGAGLADSNPPRESVIAPRYAYVWAARFDRCNFWRPYNPNMDSAFYAHMNLDWGQALWQNSQTFAWWRTNHPSWILYKTGATDATQQSQVANPFWPGDTEVALDFTNSAVLTYLTKAFANLNQNYTESLIPASYLPPAAAGTNSTKYQARYDGTNEGQYTAIGLDNVSLNNAGTAQYIWNGSAFVNVGVAGAWTGASSDINYAKDVAAYLGRYRAVLQAFNPPLKLIVNLDEGAVSLTDALWTTIMANCDGCWYEKGFTGTGTAYITDSAFASHVAWIQNYWQAYAKDFLLQHTFVNGGTTAEREYGLAIYLLLKYPQMSFSMIPLRAASTPDYGVEHWYSVEYSTNIGYPLEQGVLDQTVYRRKYSNGLVLINHLSTGAVTYNLPAGIEYTDNYGNEFSGTIYLPVTTGKVLTVKP